MQCAVKGCLRSCVVDNIATLLEWNVDQNHPRSTSCKYDVNRRSTRRERLRVEYKADHCITDREDEERSTRKCTSTAMKYEDNNEER